MNRIFFVILLAAASMACNAQIHELGVFAGGANYIGEVGPTTYIAPKNVALGLLYRWNKSPRHSWRASVNYAKISSDDANGDSPGRKQRGYSFSNTIKEVSAGLEFNFFDFNLHESGFKATPYIYTGLSYAFYDELYRDNTNHGNDYGHGSSLAIPMTFGVKAHIAEDLVLGFEASARYSFTDNLDGSNPPDNKYAATRFGNLDSNDWYVFTGFTLTYTFGNKPCYCSE